MQANIVFPTKALLALATVVVLALATATMPSSAAAASPWMHLGLSTNPTVLPEGHAQDEVQELNVAATGGEVSWVEPKSLREAEETGNLELLKYACFRYNAEDAEVQSALEGYYGAGNIEVSGGPGDPSGTKPYVLTFVGKLADRPVGFAETSFPLCGLVGGGSLEGEATLSEKTKGTPDGHLIVTVTNRGDANLSGMITPIEVEDALPAGASAVGVETIVGTPSDKLGRGPAQCTIPAPHSVHCLFEGRLAPYETLEIIIGVALKGAKAGEQNEVTASGGNARRPEPFVRPIAVGSQTPFGIEAYEMSAEAEGGSSDTQAGSHPFQLTTNVQMNDNALLGDPPAMIKDLNFHLPPGLLGNPTPFPRCTESEFTTVNNFVNACPDDTAIGVANVNITLGPGPQRVPVPLFNLVPSRGEPARFGFEVLGTLVYMDTSVRTGSDYGVTVSVDNISQDATLLDSSVTFWGVPGAASHDNSRGWSCVDDEGWQGVLPSVPPCTPSGEKSPPPLLSMPTSCTGPLAAPVEFDSWQDEGAFATQQLFAPMPAMDGCNRLPFEPSIAVASDLPDASSPSGLTVGIHLPQELVVEGEAIAESTVKDTTVELPQGVTVNPGGGDGLEACSEAQAGYLGNESSSEDVTAAFSASLPQPFCPEGAKIGTVKITTPLLPNPLTGAVYLASPAPDGEAGQNPFRTLLAMYIVAEDPVSGTLVKLPGKVELNQSTGQLVSTFEDTPQLPFEDLTLHFFGDGRAPLATPGLCGSYTTRAVFTPWSGNPPVESTSTFDISSGPNGSPCPSDPRPFTPELSAGTTNINAGGYSELRTTMGHPDEDQALGALKVTMPPGVMGSLAHVKLCPEPQASEGACGPESLIGQTTVTAGLGSTPVVVTRPGNVYITGPYKGAPYGLSIANPAEAGPFDLERGTKCDCIVVRAKVEVDPHTAQLIITSDPLPTMLKGIPLDLQHVSVQINRPQFTFNPTSCDPMKIDGTISGAEGAVASVSEPFQVANCGRLSFKPGFNASTGAKHTKADGASLKVAVTSGPGQANIHEVHVELPRQLPSRLATLQKACLVKVFESNPASCPAESVVGHAVAQTPVLPVPLKGPAYFVSHGGAKFPELIIVLQGYGVTVDLAGETFISKAGVTSSTFKSVPDVPVTRFELSLPTGPDSALGATANLCMAGKEITVAKHVRRKVNGRERWVKVEVKKKLRALSMPTTLIGQNGAEVTQTTRVGVSGCGKAHNAGSSRAAGRSRKHRKDRRG